MKTPEKNVRFPRAIFPLSADKHSRSQLSSGGSAPKHFFHWAIFTSAAHNCAARVNLPSARHSLTGSSSLVSLKNTPFYLNAAAASLPSGESTSVATHLRRASSCATEKYVSRLLGSAALHFRHSVADEPTDRPLATILTPPPSIFSFHPLPNVFFRGKSAAPGKIDAP